MEQPLQHEAQEFQQLAKENGKQRPSGFPKILNRLPDDEIAFRAGAYADAGFAWWKAGRRDKAVNSLIEAWRLADTLPRGKGDLRAFHTRKIVGHVIAWLHQAV